MAYVRYRKKMKWEHKVLCFLLAVAAAIRLFMAIPGEKVIAEVSNSDSRCSIRQEIRIIPTID